MSGIELATLIKQRKRSQHVPILFLTAHSVDEDDVLRGYGVGAVDYLSKPVNAEILRSKIGVFVDAVPQDARAGRAERRARSARSPSARRRRRRSSAPTRSSSGACRSGRRR